MDPATAAATSQLASLLPSLGAEAAAGARLMHDRRLAELWRHVAGDPRAKLVPAPGPGAGRLYELTLASHAGVVALAIASADETLLAMATANGVGGRLRSLVVEAMLDEPLARLAQRGLPGARVGTLSLAPSAGRALEGWCALEVGGAELCRLAPVSLAPRVVETLLAAHRPAPPAGGWRAGMRLPMSVVLAELRLRIALLESLAAGDVVLLPGTPASLETGTAALCIHGAGDHRLGAPGRLRNDALTLLEGLRTMAQDTPPDVGAAASIGELELPLRFEIETVSISLAELEAVEPGYVIEFGTPVSQARLRLVCCGLVVGEADLITVGNRLGARITRLVPRDE